jgi:hypothetical protein
LRIAIAVLVGLALGSIGFGMLRSLVGRTPHQPLEQIEVPSPDVRISYLCDNCKTELLLLRKGSDAPPRHCGEAMTKREEIARA